MKKNGCESGVRRFCQSIDNLQEQAVRFCKIIHIDVQGLYGSYSSMPFSNSLLIFVLCQSVSCELHLEWFAAVQITFAT